MKNKTYTLKVSVPVFTDKKTKHGLSRPMTYHVKGMMQFIRRAMPDKNKQDLLDEYAKFWVLDQLGIESTPVELK